MIYRPKKDLSSPIKIGIRQVYVLPTLKGLYYLLTIIIMFIWVINYGVSLGYILCFFAFILGFACALFAVKNIADTTVNALDNNSFFANEFSYFKLRMHSNDNTAKIRIFARRNGLYAKYQTATKEKDIIYQIPLNNKKRGVHILDYVQLSTHYPLGLFRSWTWLKFDKEIVIYPEPKGDLELPTSLETKGDESIDNSHKGNEDFSTIRHYQSGDSIKQIVWRQSTSTNVFVKDFSDPLGKQYNLDFNNPILNSLTDEDKLSQLCQWVLEADKKGVSYKLSLPQKTIELNSGSVHKFNCLKELACF